MQVLRLHIALLLLLCFTRTLLPEAWVLELHAHTHTTDEPGHELGVARKGKFLLSARHRHCSVEQFYQAAFEAAPPVTMPQRRVVAHYATSPAPLAVRAVAAQRQRTPALRGPPSRA